MCQLCSNKISKYIFFNAKPPKRGKQTVETGKRMRDHRFGLDHVGYGCEDLEVSGYESLGEKYKFKVTIM